MTSQPTKRYRAKDIFVNGRIWEPRMIESPDGEYVLASDYARLEARVKWLQQAKYLLADGRDIYGRTPQESIELHHNWSRRVSDWLAAEPREEG